VRTRSFSIGVLSTAPPTRCGIATFTSALGLALTSLGARVEVVRIVDAAEDAQSSVTHNAHYLRASDPSTAHVAVTALNQCDVALIQHEFGLYGGRDGEDVLRVLAGLRVPSVAILHTVLSNPTANQRDVLNAVIDGVDAVVVMTRTAFHILRQMYHVNVTRVRVIPHGATIFEDSGAPSTVIRPRILTWGLLGPGKGIEWVLDALVSLKDLRPSPLYVVAGQTHPKVLASVGDGYRRSLLERATVNGVRSMVHFDNSYRTLESLGALIASASVVVLPYDSTDQATSGVLVDAIAVGRPVIATAFPHAVELLGSGAGIVVDHGDAGALAAALRRVFVDAQLAIDMAAEARRLAPGLSWPTVGDQYWKLVNHLLTLVEVSA